MHTYIQKKEYMSFTVKVYLPKTNKYKKKQKTFQLFQTNWKLIKLNIESEMCVISSEGLK